MYAEFTEIIDQAKPKKVYPCPTLLSHLLKGALLAHEKKGTLKQMLTLKHGNDFSPHGVMCDVWGKVTGRGRWKDDVFEWELPHNKSWTFCHHATPLDVCKAFCHPTERLCKISQFLINDQKNSPDEYLEYFNRQIDPVEIVEVGEPVKISSSNIWAISSFKTGNDGIVSDTLFIREVADTCQEAQNIFRAKNPLYFIRSCTLVGGTAF